MKDRAPKGTPSDQPAPSSRSEQRLSAWFRGGDTRGALNEERAHADTAFAQGHVRGLEEGREAHLDSLRTVLVRVLEARDGELSDEALNQIETASPKELEDWIVRASLAPASD